MKTSVKFIGVQRFVVLVTISMFSVTMFAKSASNVVVKITNQQNQPIDYASATLRNAESQKVVKSGLSNQKGELKLKHIHAGAYYLEVNTPGFAKKTSKLFIKENDAKQIEQTIILQENLNNNQNTSDAAEKNVSQNNL
ncbi:MAG: carboxypeptidase-like regulatory domain-containing protein [Bacteroidales bacterium]|nr:carboxypeptidase-like regulatory domain-containing protein [Bacteroidales bacterium]